MKEFRTWLELVKKGWVRDDNGDLWPGFSPLNTVGEEEAVEDGWRCALRWALTQETDLQATELGDAIRKELKGN